MKHKNHIRTLSLTALGLVVLFVQMLPAQTIIDNFTIPSNWGTQSNAPGMNMTVENGRMNYTSSTVTNGGAAIPRNAPLLPTTQDWSVKVDVHLDAFALTTEEQFSDVFLGVGKTGDWFDTHVIFEFGRGWWGSHKGYYIGHDVRINGIDGPALFNAYNLNLTAPESALRMDYSAVNRTITYYFDADGPTGGYNWVAQGTASLASGPYNLNLNPTNTFTVLLVGSSEHQTVAEGQAYLANLEITVAPNALPLVESTDNVRTFAGVLDQSTNITLALLQTDATHCTVGLADNQGTPLTITNLLRIGNRIQNQIRPMPLPSENLLDFIMLSDGTNQAFVHVAQETNDADDISCMIGSWSSYAGIVTVADFVGTWDLEAFVHSNLRDWQSGF